MIRCGIDIGGTSIKLGFFEENKKGKFVSIETPKNKDEFVSKICAKISSLYNLTDIEKYVVSVPGVCENGMIVYAPNTNIVGLNILELLKTALENENILLENDANIQALAEAKAEDVDDLILLTLGTGIGGGIILDGKLLNKNGYAGEVGHIKVSFGKHARRCGCGKYGCVEAYASAKSMVIGYNERMDTHVNSRELIALAKSGDVIAQEEVANTARYLAIAIADIVSVLGIKNVRISGGLSNAGDYFFRQIRYYYPKYSVKNMERISIKRAKLGSKAGAYAAKYL